MNEDDYGLFPLGRKIVAKNALTILGELGAPRSVRRSRLPERLAEAALAERGVRLVSERAKQRGKRQLVEIAFAALKREFGLR